MNAPLRLAAVLLAAASALPAQWKPVAGHIMTRWAAEVDPRAPLPEYPRPRMTRPVWLNLNGLWDFAITPDSASTTPSRYDGQILVPFPVESALSGVNKPLLPNQTLWYHRRIAVPVDWKGQRLLLHFGAVDWHARVLVNNKQVGEHKGGYVPFSFDITSAIPDGATECDLVVAVKDPTDSWTQPRGKQTREPSGIWYTSVSGIWQTVWIEPVPTAVSISRVVPVPDIDRGEVRVVVETHNQAAAGVTVQAIAYDGGSEVGRASGALGAPLAIAIPNPTLWSPENPHLYSLRVTLLSGGSQEVDRVGSYFAMRKISIGSDQFGRTRLMLNNKPYFQLGPLDQGWWPDGLYTAPTDEALRFDIEYTKRIGMNMIRKHVKVEPARWYYPVSYTHLTLPTNREV